MATAIRALNNLPAPLLAIDLPSGLAADSGACWGDLAVRASHTLALLTLKPGLFTSQGRALSGQLWFDDLGASHASGDATLLGQDCLQHWATPAGHSRHKGSQGDVLVIGGAAGMRGAARLAARAALAAGAGRVYTCLLGLGHQAPDEADTQTPELMLMQQTRLADAATWQGRTVLCGCGGGAEVAALLPSVLLDAERLLLDADALNAVAAETGLQDLLRHRAALALPTLLTPHPLEAARLLACSTTQVQANRLAAAQQLANQFESYVVLKGSGSVIAAPVSSGLKPCINSSGSAALATAGTGDVLAGWLAGLWAQAPESEPQTLAAAAVFWHGLAGETQRLGPLRAAELVERMHGLRTTWASG